MTSAARRFSRPKLTADEYQRLLQSVWVDGTAVAEAAGGRKRLFREDIPPIDETEAAALDDWATFYGLDQTARA